MANPNHQKTVKRIARLLFLTRKYEIFKSSGLSLDSFTITKIIPYCGTLEKEMLEKLEECSPLWFYAIIGKTKFG
ncbi:hypothetical protein [Streptococcus saliviloxodontae]|uniref:Uncharacterized protein n=1 Tax=Streptococcus saliviloxodontae TaxID=1349416 RepID=A0ABS2PII6_9STRE|nr:hypothetical protein [Streptococcus saliviloxodontae]MBM7635250.1 hypothetical protein [Streptococcus saliviloxodontae]